MANLKFRYLLVILLLVGTASVVTALQYDSSKENDDGLENLQGIPLQIGEWWEGKDFPLEEMVYDILETRAIIHRSYTNRSGQNIFLSLVHYYDTKVDFHAPEGCIGGEGLKTKKTIKKVSLFSGDKKIILDIAELLTTRTNGQTLTYYFYKSGDFVGSNYIKMRLSIAANKLSKNDTGSSLIRISTALVPDQKASAEALLRDFMEDLFPHIKQSL
ncbi:MAG: exosortase C-terminal domain/associated protein EpsI [Desulforhopalus sp.]